RSGGRPQAGPALHPAGTAAQKPPKRERVGGGGSDSRAHFMGPRDKLVARSPPIGGEQEQFGLAFEKGNPLVPCVNQAIATLESNGTLQQLQGKWLTTDASVPVFS